jgi:hypothetical protein
MHFFVGDGGRARPAELSVFLGIELQRVLGTKRTPRLGLTRYSYIHF